MKTKKNLSLYIHIPFCVQKCKYCDFLSFSSSEEDRNSYITQLKEELRLKSKWAEGSEVISIFFGGGTPSILEGGQIAELLKVIRAQYHIAAHAEITIEANPGTLTKEKLKIYRENGINRLSIGLQSADNKELAMLGRIHTMEDFQKNFKDAREAGFDNINIDLMSALPGQDLASYRRTLEKIIKLQPEHISAYSLIVEEGTPLSQDKKLLEKIPDEEEDRKMYQFTKEFLHIHGYERYEISNYAKPGWECQHNCVYWTGGDYLGIGLGASSYFKGERFRNEDKMASYRFDGTKKEAEMLTKEEKIEEFMFLGLRMTKGILEAEFLERFACPIEEVYGDILKKQQQEGLIVRTDGRIFLTEKGLDVSNYVFCDYLF